MSSVLTPQAHVAAPDNELLRWAPVVFGLVLMYAPTYYFLATTLWHSEEYAHGPICLGVFLWALWKNRAVFATPPSPWPLLGGATLAVGLLLYALGRGLGITLLEVGSQIPVLVGVVLFLLGPGALRSLWFPILFLAFVVPLPGFLLETLTGVLRHQVAAIVTEVLYWFGYPIARQGVILTVGQYQLEVANACSGLNSMYSLTALGLLYIYLMRYPGYARNLLLVLSVWPIAFVANLIRVATLVLVTYYLGDEAGQGFFHGFAGMTLFVLALGFLFGFDFLLGRFLGQRSEARR